MERFTCDGVTGFRFYQKISNFVFLFGCPKAKIKTIPPNPNRVAHN